MEEYKFDKKIGIIVFLSVLVVMLIGYIVYDKVFAEEKCAPVICDNVPQNESDKPTIQPKITITSKDNYPLVNDTNVKSYTDLHNLLSDEEKSTNFQNLEKIYGNEKVLLSCAAYAIAGTDITAGCNYGRIKFETGVELDLFNLYNNSEYTIYKYGDKYVTIFTYLEKGIMDIKIYKASNEVLYQTMNAKTDYTLIEGNKIDTKPVIVDGKLYFIKLANDDFNDIEFKGVLEFVYVDLAGDTLKATTIEKFSAIS